MSLTPKPAASFLGAREYEAPWSPEQATLALLDQVRGVLDEYEARIIPMDVIRDDGGIILRARCLGER